MAPKLTLPGCYPAKLSLLPIDTWYSAGNCFFDAGPGRGNFCRGCRFRQQGRDGSLDGGVGGWWMGKWMVDGWMDGWICDVMW